MHPFGRVLTAMITPFTADGAVDHETAFALARHLVDNGSDGLVVSGTTGESPTLSSDEKLALFVTVTEAVGGRAKVVAGTGTYDTAESVHLSQRAAEAGVDGLLAVTPYYSKPEQKGLIAHFTAMAEATDLDVMLYNIPGRTGRLIEIPTLERLAEHERIVAVKDAVMDIDHTSEVCRRIPHLTVYSGQDSYTFPMMAVGAVGVVSVISHLAGRQVRAMVDAALAGDMERARELHRLLLPLCWACFVESNPAPVRSAMGRWWQPVGPPRLPVVPATDETLAEIEAALIQIQEQQ
ncbi:MAG: 4-hydroxy-tetrahydrodipicolinate synthase [Acidimicrobiia bacterium]|nr:4-hydroxy-tetrahydrodipicolinate synthase [Acidimicrobiia bacterium]